METEGKLFKIAFLFPVSVQANYEPPLYRGGGDHNKIRWLWMARSEVKA